MPPTVRHLQSIDGFDQGFAFRVGQGALSLLRHEGVAPLPGLGVQRSIDLEK